MNETTTGDTDLAGVPPSVQEERLEQTSELHGVPGLGTVRRRLLAEAGITTRAALAQASPEQLVSLVGMPLAAAQAALRFVAPSPVAASEPELTNPATDGGVGEALADMVPGEDAPVLTRLERAALRAQTVIADASRHAAPESKLAGTLLRFARLTDELPRRVSPLSGAGVVKRIALRLETIAARLEALPNGDASHILSDKRAKRLRQRLKRTRDSIKQTLRSADNKGRKAGATVLVSVTAPEGD